jgi:dolichol-phosphate mannosyltransferase
MAELSVIISIYSEEENIPILFERFNGAISHLKIYAEYIFINDGNKDNSILIIKRLSSKDSSIKYIYFSRNFSH